MKSPIRILAATALILTFAPLPVVAAAVEDTTRTCPGVTTSEIEVQFDRFSDAWATRDPDDVISLFSAEPVLLPTVSNLPRTTPAGVRDYFASFLTNSPVARIDTSTIEIDCHTASRVGTWTVTLTDPATGAAREVHARYSFIYRFEAGDWKIDHLHSSAMPEAGPAPTH